MMKRIGTGKKIDTDDIPTGQATTITGADGSEETFIHIAVPDRPLAVVAVGLLKTALEKCDKALLSVKCQSLDVRRRLSQCEELSTRLISQEPVLIAALGFGVPAPLIDTLKVGLSLELESAAKVMKSQTQLVLDVDETEQRITKLQAFLAALDVAGLGTETTQE